MSAARRLLERTRELGIRHVALDASLRASRAASRRLEDALLEIEQRAGVLGPAHRSWRGNSVEDNRDTWNGWDWSARGEEWTLSEAWKQGLVDEVLLPTIPAGGTVLEIGPGGGRWSSVLAPRSERLVVVDVAQAVLDVCAERLAGAGVENVTYVLGDGRSLPGVPDGSVDAVWSFDVFVHIAPLDQVSYLEEIARVLRPGGVAAIHHADGRNRGDQPSRHGWRTPMSGRLFARLAADAGLTVERQFDSWGGGRFGLEAYHDLITVLRH